VVRVLVLFEGIVQRRAGEAQWSRVSFAIVAITIHIPNSFRDVVIIVTYGDLRHMTTFDLISSAKIAGP